MRKSKGISLIAKLNGEMNIEDVPVASWANIEALKGGDTDPLEVVMAIPSGKSTRGWNYTSNALNSIVGEVNSTGLPGFLGHQKAENVSTEFPTPVTHWIGAKMENGTAYFRGLIDKSATDLKRWIRGKAINQVSIYGYPELQQNSITGETDVTDYKGLSIDWTPLNRAGMPTSVAAIAGEMDTIAQSVDASHEALRETLRIAVYNKLGKNSDDIYIGINSVYDDYFIAYCDERNTETKYYKINYTKAPDKNILLGEPIEVKRIETWQPINKTAGEMKGIKTMNKDLKALLDSGKLKPEELATACGEMKIDLPNEFEKTCGEMFGKTGNDLVEAVKSAAKLVKKADDSAIEECINKVLKEKVSGEMAQGLVKKMLHIDKNADEKMIAGEIDDILADKTVQAVLANSLKDTAIPPVNSNVNDNISCLFAVTKTAI